MGQAIRKLMTGREEEEITPIIDQCYDSLFADTSNIHNLADFYHAISRTMEEINTKLGKTQFHIPSTDTLEKVFKEGHKGKESSEQFTKDEFIKILLRVIFETGATGTGAKEVVSFMFGLLNIFQENHQSKRNENPIAKKGLPKIFQYANFKTGPNGKAMDMLFFIFGVPITSLFLKQSLMPIPLPNEVFIPGVTSATVFVLAKLKKI